MKKLLVTLTLMLTAGTAAANGGLTLQTAPQSPDNLPRVTIDVHQLGHGSIDKFEAYNEKRLMALEAAKKGQSEA